MAGDPPAVWLSNLITARLAEPGWSQDRIADLTGVSQAAVSKWVKGTARIQIEQAIRLAPVLDQDVVPFVHQLWPELAAADPVPAELRELVADATPKQRREIVARARTILAEPGSNVVRLREADHQAVRDAPREQPAAAKKRAKKSPGENRRARRPQPPTED